jgi:hypothetical protein
MTRGQFKGILEGREEYFIWNKGNNYEMNISKDFLIQFGHIENFKGRWLFNKIQIREIWEQTS